MMNGWAGAGNSQDLNDCGPAHASWTTSWPSITFAGDASASSSTVNDEKALHAASRFRASRHEMAQDPSAWKLGDEMQARAGGLQPWIMALTTRACQMR